MSTAGNKLLAKLLLENSPVNLRKVSEILFTEEELPNYHFVQQHFIDYGQFPSGISLADANVVLPFAQVEDENFDYFLERCKKRAVYNAVSSNITGLTTALRNNDRGEVVNLLTDMLRSSTTVDAFNEIKLYSEEVLDILDDMDNYLRTIDPNAMGIPLGIAELDNLIGGAQGGDLIVFAGRPNLGKSYILMNGAHAAWNNGCSVLMYSMEMTVRQQARRLLALDSTISSTYIQRQTLSPVSRNIINIAAEEAQTKAPFWLVSGNFKKSVADLEMAIRENRPDVVFVDSAYLLKPSTVNRNRQRRDEISETIVELKGLATELNIPIIISVQFNRNMKRTTKQEVDLAFLAETDVIGQAASIVFAIMQGDSPREESTRKIKVIKNREGAVHQEFFINYVFNPRMDLSSYIPLGTTGEGEDVSWMM